MLCPKQNKKNNKTGNEQDCYLNGIVKKGHTILEFSSRERLTQVFYLAIWYKNICWVRGIIESFS